MTNADFLILFMVPLFGAAIGGYFASRINAASTEKVARLARLHELSIAALDKRLQAHQEAYTHLVKILRVVHNKDEVSQLLRPALDWWDLNCIYLFPDVSNKLRATFMQALGFEAVMKMGNSLLTVKYFDEMNEVLTLLQTSIGLPKIVRDDLTPSISKTNEPSGS